MSDSLPETLTDAALLLAAGRGDQAAFRVVYERHRTPVFRFAYRLVGSVETAEDVTHDCFLVLLREPERFDPDRASLRTYLFAVARNLVLKEFRRSGRESSLTEGDGGGGPALYQHGRNGSPLRQLLDEELSATVREAVQALPPLQREALVLFEYEGLSLGEISGVVGSDVGAVKSRLFRARERLRQDLGPYLNKGPEIANLEKA